MIRRSKEATLNVSNARALEQRVTLVVDVLEEIEQGLQESAMSAGDAFAKARQQLQVALASAGDLGKSI